MCLGHMCLLISAYGNQAPTFPQIVEDRGAIFLDYYTSNGSLPNGDYQRERGQEEVEEDKGAINGDGRRLDLGW